MTTEKRNSKELLDCSVALCNIGVSLLATHHSYKDAQFVLSNGLLLHQEHQQCSTTKLGNEEKTREVLLSARKMVSHGSKQLTDMSSPFHMQVLCHDDGPFEHKTKISKDSNTGIILLVKISSILCAADTRDIAQESNTIDFVLAIVLQNLASTYLCLSFHQNRDQKRKEKVLMGSYRLFCASETTLVRLLQKLKDATFVSETTFVLSLVLRNLIQVTHYLGMPVENEGARAKLQDIQNLIARYQQLGLSQSCCMYAPSA